MSAPRENAANRPLRSDMARTGPDRVMVRGHDLCKDILGKLSLGDMAWLELHGTLPTQQQSIVFNALLVVLVEHGMTPMAMAARLTYLGAPESMQAAVAAGLCGMGSAFAGTSENCAAMLAAALAPPGARDDVHATARSVVAQHAAAKKLVPGIGHNIHKPVDPRTVRLFEIAAQNGIAGIHVDLLQAVGDAAQHSAQRVLPVNAAGAVGAVALDLGIDPRMCRGLAVIGRAVGLVGHLAEELRQPLAYNLWARTDAECNDPLE